MVYCKPKDASFPFVKMMDPESYLNKLLASEVLREQVMRHMNALLRVMSNSQIKIDFNFNEVSSGYCFKISERKFVSCPFSSEDFRKISPRTFVAYDPSTPPEPKYFKEGILNSFPDLNERIQFLNKYYQCLMVHRMPHKIRKLVVWGLKDSGKTSWFNVFLGLIPMKFIASITNEKQFSVAMISDETQLVFLVEWSKTTLQSDMAKTVLQGGLLVKSIKHQTGKCIINNSPFYITTNDVPNFGNEDENVKRRIIAFETKSLPETRPGIDKWLCKNAMDCIVWTAEEIEHHRSLIDSDELWYEKDCIPNDEDDFVLTSVSSLLDMNDVISLRTKNIALTSTTTALANTSSPGKFIHKIQREEALILAQRAIEEQECQRKENEVKNMKARAYLLQQSSSESENSDSNASTKPAGPLNTKKFHRRVMEELKGNFFRVELQFTHKKMAEQKLQRMEILDAEHCAWLMVLAKTRPEFDHNLFLRRYLKWF